MLTKDQLRSIANYLMRQARPLEVVRYRHHMEGADPLPIMHYLQAYQNPDGGYAHGLEPDNQSPHSNPISSWYAMRMMRKLIESPVTTLQVKRLFDYLDQTEAFVDGRWRATVPENNDYPHAPWWEHDPETEAENWGYNPTAEIAGFILCYDSHQSKLYAKAEAIIPVLVERIMQSDYGLTGYELANVTTMYKDLLVAGRLDLVPDGFGDFLQERVKQSLASEQTEHRQGEYNVSPMYYIMGTDSPYYAPNQERAEAYADFLEASLEPEGYWEPAWEWGDAPMPETVRRDWRGIITLENLLYLKGLGRI